MRAIGDDLWIEDADGNELSKIQEKKLTVRDKMTIESGSTQATVRKRLIGVLTTTSSTATAART